MAPSKRSQILLRLGKKAAEDKENNIRDVADDASDISDAFSRVTSAAPSLSESSNRQMNDMLSKVEVCGLEEEKKSELTQKWVSSQSGAVTVVTKQSTNSPIKIVDYSPSHTASSRFSSDSRASKKQESAQLNRDNLRQPFKFSQQGNLPRSSHVNIANSSLKLDPTFKHPTRQVKRVDHNAVHEDLMTSSESLPNPEHSPKSSRISSVKKKLITSDVGSTQSSNKNGLSTKQSQARNEVEITANSSQESQLNYPTDQGKTNVKSQNALYASKTLSKSSEKKKTSGRSTLNSSQAGKKKDSGVYKDEVRQTRQSKRKTGTESRAPSPDFFDSEDNCAESNKLLVHSTPKSSRISSGKKKKPIRGVPEDVRIQHDVEEQNQCQKETQQSQQEENSQLMRSRQSSCVSNSSESAHASSKKETAAVSENRTINGSSNKPLQITTLTDSNQLFSCSTPKSSQAENKNNSGVSVENLSQSRPIRKTRLKPQTRLPSPDIFASEEENWESEDSLRLESPSSSSSSSLTTKTPTRKKRKLEVAEMIDDSDEERNLVPQKKIRKKKSTSYLSKEEKSMRQHLRNSGQAYVTYYSNKKVGPRKRKQPHVCKRNYCHITVPDDIGESLFSEYWEQASYEKRVAYISARLEACPIKVKRPRLPPGHKKAHPKSVMWKYYFHIHGEVKQVCKKTFLGTLGETDGFVRFVVINKKRKLSGVTRDGQRGKKSAKHKLTDEKINGVTQHVLKFPSYKSHYKRAEVGDRRYLPSHLNIKQMHQMYLNEGGNVSYSTYERIFNTLGRSFRKPPTDTCAKCDAWQQKLEHTPDQVTKEEVQKEWNVHLDRAQVAYDLKRKCKVQAETDKTLRVLIFDLEQVLETPLLSAGETFYLRQLSTYNLTIYDTTSKLTHCYMWCELDGNRGANDIASCIFVHFLEEIPDTVKKVVLFSDSTVSQNRNSIVAAMFLTVLQMHCSVKSIEHVFLEAGHTRLEVDSKHSVIERNKNNVDKICVPSDWYDLVRSIGSSNKEFPNGRFKVVEMKGEFYDFHSLLKGPLVKRTITTTKDKFNWLTTPLLRYDANKPGKIFFKGSLGDNGYGCLDFQRRGKAGEYSAKNLQNSLKPIYQEPLPVSTEKKKDLMKLLKLLPPRCHDFYKSISASDAITDDKDDEDSSSSESE